MADALASVFVDDKLTSLDIGHWRVDEIKPWLIEIWEPLTTKVPSPKLALPYCCYINTVIFYVRPFVVRPWHHFWMCNGVRRAEKPGVQYEEWARIETLLNWETIIVYKGEIFTCGGGRVIWKNKRWWMKRDARRKREGD